MSAYEALAFSYDGLTQDIAYEETLNFVESVLQRLGKSPKTVLDLACGTGSLSVLLARKGYVVFMDIQMPGMNGMDAAAELRDRDKTVSLIFITNLVQFAQKGYEVDAVSFLVKPVSYFDFSLKFKKALDVYVMNEERSFTVKYCGGMCRISTDKLMYVEIIAHRLYYRMIDGDIEVTGVLSEAEKELSRFGFLRCNKCYLVNPRFIIGINGSDLQVGNATLQISRPRRAAFLSELAKWYAGRGGDE